LAWILCFYDGDRGAPGPAELLLGHDAWELMGYPAFQRAGWRLFTDAGGGVGVVGERDGDHPRVVALIMGRPERMTALLRRLRPPRGPAASLPVLSPIRAQPALRLPSR
jgi:hypothetical protein